MFRSQSIDCDSSMDCSFAANSCLSGNSNQSQGCLKRSHSSTCSLGLKKNVSFDCIEIREFPVELGDNPSVLAGPPIQLGWEAQSTDMMELDVYEVFRSRRRERDALPISEKSRVETLLRHGYSREEMLAAEKECDRVKQERFSSLPENS